MRSGMTAIALYGVVALTAGWWHARAPGGEPSLPGMAATGAAPVPTAATASVPATESGAFVVVSYFFDNDAGRYVPVTLRLPRPLPVVEAAVAAFSALCAGPPATARQAGRHSALPTGCRVQGAQRSGATLQLAVNPEFLRVPAASAQRWADQVELTAAQFPAVRQVVLTLQGQKAGMGPGGIRLPLQVDGRPGR